MSDDTHRTDLLRSPMNGDKKSAVLEVLRAWRRCAVRVAGEQRRRFFGGGGFWKDYRNPDEQALTAVAGNAARVQMIRYQVVGLLRGFMEARQADFQRRVARMVLDPQRRPWLTKRLTHELHYINTWKAWFKAEPLAMKDGSLVSDEARRVARWLMRDILGHNRWPDVSRINMVMDGRGAKVAEAIEPHAYRNSRERAAQPKPDRELPTRFPLWVHLTTMESGKKIWIPIESYDYHEERAGRRTNSVQVNLTRDGEIVIGLVTDVAKPFKESRERYVPRTEELTLDWGMRILLATDQGDLLGRGFLDQLRVYDHRVSRLAAYRQKHGLRTRSPRYDREVRRLQGFLKTEIGRVFNRLVETHAPKRLIVERLHFRNPDLSRRMNRLVTNAGRTIVQKKLKALTDEFGIEVVELNPAYSSQECHACGYVDRKNRKNEKFKCLWCGRKVHADVNAPRALGARRSRPVVGPGWVTKATILCALVRRHAERFPKKGRWGTSRDPRGENPYFLRYAPEVTSNGAVAASASAACATPP